MADQNSSFMDYSKISEVINDWDGAINRFDGDIPILGKESCFLALIDAGLDSGFVNKYDQNIQSMVSSLRNTTTTLSDYLKSMEELENDIDNDEPKDKPDDDDKDRDRDRGGGPTGGQATKILINNINEQFSYYMNMPIDNLNKLIDDMYVLAEENKVTLDELLKRTEFSSIIQAKILESPNISDDLKELILNGETEITQKILSNILSAEDNEMVDYILGIDETTMMPIIKMLDNKALDANVDIDTFLQDGSNVKETFKDINKTKSVLEELKEEDMNQKLMDIYNGYSEEEISESVSTSVRSFLDQSSAVENSTVEDLLATKNMSESVGKLNRTVSFLSNLNKYSNDGAKQFISNLLARNITITTR